MPIIRRRLQASTVYPDDIRYDEATDTVQSLVNGEWVDNPDADPRTHTTLPPRITSDTACDAAQSVVDALKGQIQGVIDAIDAGSTVFAIAGIILSIFTLGTFAIFVSLALGIGDQMLGAGTTALSAALTEPVYDTLKCILKCQFNNSGRISASGLAVAQGEVTDQIGGLGATILNAMLSLAGTGGVNNIAAQGTSDGDCDECDPCGEPCGDTWSVVSGTFLGVFDGYYRYRSTVSGDQQLLELGTGSNAICCKLFDYRFVTYGAANFFNLTCNDNSLHNGWGLEGCYWAFSASSNHGDLTVFEVEFLFIDC